ncbi:MAG: L-glutamate gamma-semialdehyde dehydrogenase [Candidatus Brocadiae bacterium]|nr:L-glutamate gamma-semialdehyde dehydrogenase [Candidatus Brocadiia bacterium]
MKAVLHKIPQPTNEPILSYKPSSEEKRLLKLELERQSKNPIEIPLFLGGKEIKSGKTQEIFAPHNHSLKLGVYHKASKEHAEMAIQSCRESAKAWARMPWQSRAAIFLKAADLLAGPYRAVLNAATMLGQSKTVFQSEIDAACELCDFWRFNAFFMQRIYEDQPMIHAPYTWNATEYRPLEGFVFAISPFNFTSIAGNLCGSPLVMGNVVIWKPASTAMLSAYYIMKIFEEAGLPKGVLQFLPGNASEMANPVLDSPDLAGVHFTGSSSTFNRIWARVGENLSKGVYKTYPRLVGETGGKDFVIAAPDADPTTLAVALFRGAFEYQGQKCSAASRAYVPKSIWPTVKSEMRKMAADALQGDVCDFRNFTGAVIDKASYTNIVSYIEYAKNSPEAQIAIGGKYSDAVGYFVEPTVIETTNPHFKLMEEEIFGPVLAVYVFEDNKLDETLDILDKTSPYALTGAVFSKNRETIIKMSDALVNAAGNFYINDKPTGAVVGQQPFGGARNSGTNDKAGSMFNLIRWTSMRTIKENFLPPSNYRYPYMQEA